MVNNLPANVGDADLTLDWEDPPEEEMANHSSILAWEISWTEILEDYSPWSKEKFEVKKTDRIAQLMLEWIFYQEIEEVHVR